MQFIFLFLKDLVPLFDWLSDNNCPFALVNTAKNYKLAQFQQYFHIVNIEVHIFLLCSWINR